MKIQIEDLQFQKDAIKTTLDCILKGNKEDLAIEMETGTGKTFTFISTIFQIYQEFKHNKFIIVVPRVAIKEGIYKTFEVFAEYFQDEYDNLIYDVHNYEKGKLGIITNFINGGDLQILILTKQSFDKETNILRDQERDALFGNGSQINQIKGLRPIVIVDEPQLNKKFNLLELKKLLNPKFLLSYSATHPKENKDNIIYKYTPEQAYNDRQVKRLEYFAVELEGKTKLSLYLEKVDQAKQSAKIKYGSKTYSIKKNDILGKKLNDNKLDIYKVKFITTDNIQFVNGAKLSDLISSDEDEFLILKEQIRQTLFHHKEKKEQLNNNKIKQISLFFVSRVSDFIGSNENPLGIVKQIFIKEYRKIFKQEAEVIDNKYAYYFSEATKIKDKTNDGKEQAMTRLILKDKEELLSMDNEVEFIFAHTSLGIGWDNPNIFNICFLRNIAGEDNKRQYVGRGLRLCINQKGERLFEDASILDKERLNNLTIIGGLQYEQFCGDYQKESSWGGSKESNIKNAKERQSKIINIKKDKKDLAKELWKRLQPKTKWYIEFKNKESFYKKIAQELENLRVEKKSITITGGDIKVNYDDNYQNIEIKTNYNKNQLIKSIKDKTWFSVKEIKKIISNVDIDKVKNNPDLWIKEAINIIEIEKKDYIMATAEVIYKKNGNKWDENNFVEDKRISYHEDLKESEKSLFDLVDCDSNEEKKFVNLADNTPNIELFVKLPKGSNDKFHINTPIGKYTPDFALLLNSNNKLYMVFEVKSKKPKELDPEERFKIKCAIKHFEELGFATEKKYIEHQGADSLELSQLQQKDSFSVYIPKNNNL